MTFRTTLQTWNGPLANFARGWNGPVASATRGIRARVTGATPVPGAPPMQTPPTNGGSNGGVLRRLQDLLQPNTSGGGDGVASQQMIGIVPTGMTMGRLGPATTSFRTIGRR